MGSIRRGSRRQGVDQYLGAMRAAVSRLGGWIRRWGDGLLVAALGGLGLFEIFVAPVDTWVFPGSGWRHVPFLAGCVLPLLWRRRAPVLVLAVVATSSLGWMYGSLQGAQAPIPPFIAQLVAAYTVAAVTEGRRFAQGLGVLALLLAGDLPGLLMGRPPELIFPGWVMLGFAVAAGRVVHDRTRLAQRLRQTAAALEIEREARTAEAISTERVRIARELHDVITHAMSGIVIQAGVEARATAERDQEAAAVLAGIERSGREVLVELRRLLGALRMTPGDSLAPQPSLRNLEGLLKPLRQTGVDVTVAVDGDLDGVPTGVDLSAYRIIQEAVTNVMKHADARTVTVHVQRSNGHVDLEVSDDGRGGQPLEAPTPTGAGHGLIGMRERARLCGGHLEAGPREPTGFRVRSHLPLDGRPA